MPRLTQTQLAAFAEFNRLAGLEELRMDMKLQPGDIQLLHNHSIVHCRSGFTDYEVSFLFVFSLPLNLFLSSQG